MDDSEVRDKTSGTNQLLWSSRVLRRSLFDADGTTVGTIHDLILALANQANPPQLRGFVAQVDRRKIFIDEARVDVIDSDGVHLRGGTVDLRHFKQRPGELLISEIAGSPTILGPIADIGFVESSRSNGTWLVHQIAAGVGRIRRRHLQTLPWSEISEDFHPDPIIGELARISDLHKADAAEAIQSLSNERRTQLASALETSRLADVLEELPEEQQIEIISNLDTEDAVAVLDEMETDDEIDLLKQMTTTDRETFLAEMPKEEVALLRSLLSYREDTAGGMMTPEAIILQSHTTVAEAVARLRDAQLPPALMVRVFVTAAPTVTPTGIYQGTVTLSRLLKEPPYRSVGDCLEDEVPLLSPVTPESEVAKLLARYDLLAVPVVNSAKQLVGIVTVDDVIVRLIENPQS